MTDKNKVAQIEDRLEEIIQRLETIEEGIGSSHDHGYDESKGEAEKKCCGLPVVPLRELEKGIDPGRERLIRSIEKKWANGTELKYFFYSSGNWSGSNAQQNIVRKAFEEWMEIGLGITFNEIDDPDHADIRIGFLSGDGSWSYVGRDIWNIPGDERTMNFGWRLSGQDGRDTALHEIGHTMGFHHEQQNPFAGIQWDEQAVYNYFMGPPNNWPKATVQHNILNKLDPNSVEGSEWDPNSIMQYAFGPGLILRPSQFSNGLFPKPGLSDTDRERVRLFYPAKDRSTKQLKRFKTEVLDLRPAEQINFVIQPTKTRNYQIQTFGSSDVLMVLFEDNNGTLEHLAADDDSGWDRNASIKVRLVRDRKYTLRVRLYSSLESGGTAVMYW